MGFGDSLLREMLGYFDLCQDRNRGEGTGQSCTCDLMVIMRVVAEITGRASILEREEL